MKSILISFVTVLVFLTSAQAESFPKFEFESGTGEKVLLGHQQDRPQLIVLGKAIPKHRKSNLSWMEALKREFGEGNLVDIFLIGDLSGRPSFVSKSMLKNKLREKPKKELTHFLLDWNGTARKSLAKDSQHYVYLVSPSGSIVEKVGGVYKAEKLQKLSQALQKLTENESL